MCTVLLPPGVNPIAVNKYIISYINRNCSAVARIRGRYVLSGAPEGVSTTTITNLFRR